MKILEIGMGANLGGIEVYFHNYYSRFSDEFHFDFTDKDGGLFFSDEYIKNGSIIYHMPDFNKHPFRYYSNLKRIIKDGKYDAVHINMLSLANILPLFAAKAAGAKAIIHSHNAGVPSGFLRKGLHSINKIFVPLADIRLACSELAGNWMFGNHSFTVIQNAIDLTVFNLNDEMRTEQRRKLGYCENDLVIGHVGRFAEQKNHKFIIELFKELHLKSDRYKLLLVGDGELKKSIEDKVREYGLSGSVTFTGSVNNVQNYMQAMDLFILPSLFEGLGIVCIEAQACGLPCILSSVVPKTAQLTDSVEFIPLENKKSWIDAIEKLIIQKRTNNTEKVASGGYNIEKSVEKFESVFKMINNK